MNARLLPLKTLTLALVAVCGFSLNTYAQVQIGQDIDGEAAWDDSGMSVCMPDAFTIAIGAQRNDSNGIEAGHVRIFSWNGTIWAQKGNDIDGEAVGDRSGWSVSMPDANTVAIGAPFNNGSGPYSGHVRIYTWNGSSWTQKGIDIDGEATDDYSGYSVSMPDANAVAIGAPENSDFTGHVRVYEWNATAWAQKGSDIDGEANGDNSGRSVSMPDANTLAIGAYGNDSNGTDAGHVRIYSWNGSTWMQKGSDIDGEAAGDRSGWSVSMPDANTVAIGADRNDGNGTNAGHVRIYTWNSSAWTQKGIDIDGVATNDESGRSVSMPDANTVAVGGDRNDNNGTDAGHVRIYDWNGSTWTQKGIDIDGEAAGDRSGWSVNMPDTNTVAIGAPGNGGNGTSAGHVRVYGLIQIASLIEESTNPLTQNSIFPNPTNGEVKIVFENEQHEVRVSLLSIAGQLLESKTYQNSEAITFEIDGPAGVYLLKLNSNGEEATIRVVKE